MENYIDALICHTRDSQASDLFLSEGSVARLKLHETVRNCGERVVTHEEMAALWKHCGADPATGTDRDTSLVLEDETRFRVNLHRHCGKLGAVLRLIKTNIPMMNHLGLPEELITKWLQRTSGLLLVTGPSGSGKSTTLASALEWINQNQARHVVTIEDPIEYVFKARNSFFTQREVGTDTATFSTGLRSALRQAPDVIFIGEIRDAETALVGLQAAETGHLVLGTLHSSTVVDTLERLANLVGTNDRESLRLLLSYQLVGIISQQLIPSAGNDSLTLVCEHLEVQAAVRDWIRTMKLEEIQDFLLRRDNPNNIVFMHALLNAYQTGQISYEVALAHCGNTHEFARLLRGIT